MIVLFLLSYLIANGGFLPALLIATDDNQESSAKLGLFDENVKAKETMSTQSILY